jgi:hypothetical protein
MEFYKKWWFWVIIVLSIIIITIILIPGNSSKSICGLYNFAAPYSEDCNCIGIKTNPCAGIGSAGSCDKGTSYCIGVREECFRIWNTNQSKEIVQCRE